MQLSETVKVYPTEYQKTLIIETMTEYIDLVNRLVSDAASGHSIAKTTTADLHADLPSALANQCIRDAKSIVRKHCKICHKAVLKNRSLAKRSLVVRIKAPNLPIRRKLCCYINNQNYKMKENGMEFPVMINGKSKRISVPVKLTECQESLFSDAKFGTMRIVIKNNRFVAHIVYERVEPELKTDGKIMGIDLGIKFCRSTEFVCYQQTLEQCMVLFREVSAEVAKRLSYQYPPYDEKISGYVVRHKTFPIL